jgi:hypothetical protein
MRVRVHGHAERGIVRSVNLLSTPDQRPEVREMEGAAAEGEESPRED